MSGGIMKWYEKRWTIANIYKYDIYQVMAGNLIWYVAEPCTKGVMRCANTENELRTILENDCLQIIKFQKQQQKQKQRLR